VLASSAARTYRESGSSAVPGGLNGRGAAAENVLRRRFIRTGKGFKVGTRASTAGPVLVSACLLGLRTRWDGAHRRDAALLARLDGRWVVPVCPEQLGGLPTPRTPAEIERGDGLAVLDGLTRVVAQDGTDVTDRYVLGARQVVSLARLLGARVAILKEGSPACGVHRIKRGGGDVDGCGVAAAALAREGLRLEGID